ncbi:cation:proton antiporter [Flavobacterium sp. Sd200]|uniref:cation:proton antiporter n=1 Tax=Flavobacterium TaxID=237 RepID=UPI000E324AEF|nr:MULTISPECIES: cation:proton antiporter [Flavobacterium]MXN89638.1 cation:proton antiporter [Flavobacterium sp. Sd200]
MSSQLFSGMAVLSFLVLLLILLLRKLKQPYFIAYILSGLILGPELLNIIHEPKVISELGEIGIVMLMFTIGSDIDLHTLRKNFYKPLLIAIVQLALSFVFMYLIGIKVGWTREIIILTSFIISLSSSAIIFQYLSRTGEIKSQLGVITCGVLLIQDILVVPMILTLNMMSGSNASVFEVIKVCIGGTLIFLFLSAAIKHKLFQIPMGREIISDHDLQVFVGFCICFGMAWFSAWFGLSPAFGAFSAGILISQDKATRWLEKSILPFRVFFMAFFFLAVGLQLDITFFKENAATILFITISVLIINSLINTVLFRATGNSWRDSLYGGALLSQIGEFSFVLVTMASSLGLVGNSTYQVTLSVITCTMLFTSIWLNIIQKLIYRLT